MGAVTFAELASSRNLFILDGLKVLLIEDEPDTATLFTFILQDAGAQVIPVISVVEAIYALDNFHPNLLISIRLPTKDGCKLMKIVRSREAENGKILPAIAITGSTTDEDCKFVQEAGFQMHISQPVDPKEFTQAVSNLVFWK
ncbi:MAG: response regulator [Scytonema sp. PMC 1069.18]|nr:response regulator [Scytonema sp. PMC 1069.18]MEC4888224.1 response regulator [Scytonema sp. PMC 1070.18]